MFQVLQTIGTSPDININPPNNNEECIQAIVERLEQKSKTMTEVIIQHHDSI